MNIDEMKDRIARAEEIQRYTENRCETLEKENAELKEQNNKAKELLTKIMKNTWSIDCFVVKEIEKFISEVEK